MRSLLFLAVVVWLVIGGFAAFQRGYVSGDRDVKCATAADIALTVVAGPLNYAGVNPKVDCKVAKPSK